MVEEVEQLVNNLVVSSDTREFFVWVDMNKVVCKHNYEVAGGFCSIPYEDDADLLMFLPNPKFQGFVSIFQANLLWGYFAEYNLELSRRLYFPNYPSRLAAVFLFETEEESNRYQKRHPDHVGGRELKRVRTDGNYTFSRHDLNWVDFLRHEDSEDPETLDNVGKAYWSGASVQDCKLMSMGKPWSQERITEILLLGRVNFIK